MLEAFNIDLSILATSGVDKELNLCTPELNRMLIKQTAIRQSERKILVSDASKFYRKSLYRIVPLQTFDAIITDLDKEELGNVDLKKTKLFTLYCPIDTKESSHA